MNNLDWKMLTVLYEQRSISKAAKALFVTQSALTKRLKSIEEEWNIEVVRRNSKGVIFTEEGKYLVKKATIMLDFLDEIQEHFGERGDQKELIRIGVPNSYASLHFPKLLNAYINNINRLQFKSVLNSSDIIVKQLSDEVIDIGIICGDYPYEGEKVKLFKEDLHLMVPSGITIDDAVQLPLIESYMNPLVKKTIEGWWKSHYGSKPHEEHCVPHAEIAVEMVENGLGVCCIFGNDWRVDHTKVQLLPIYNQAGETISRNVWMMISKPCLRSQAIMDFVTFVESYYQVN